MNSPLLSLALAGAALAASAQEAVTLDQGLHLQYSRWQMNQEAATVSMRGSYNFSAAMPLFDYRLGTLGLGGAVDYASASGVASTIGLNSYGLGASLFPYRPFHLLLTYGHSQSPKADGMSRLMTDTYGITLNYRGRTVKDLQISLREGRSSQGSEAETWSIASMNTAQQFGRTKATLIASHQEFATNGAGSKFQDSYFYGSTDTDLSQDWSFRSNAILTEQAGSHGLNAGGSLLGRFGHVAAQSSLELNEQDGIGGHSANTTAAQSLTLTMDRYNLFGSLVMNKESAQAGLPGSDHGAVNVGAGFSITPQWRIYADVALSQASNSSNAGASSGNMRSFHVGVSEGGDVPELVKHALFFLSNDAFSRRIQEEYAPGYVPSELAEEMQRRRIRQGGNVGFSGDLFHSETADGGKLEWLRITGDLKLTEGLRIFTMGDLRREDAMGTFLTHRESKNLSMNAAEVFGHSALSGSIGFSRGNQFTQPGPASPGSVNPLTQGDGASSSKFYTLAFNSDLKGVPYGVLWTRFAGSTGPATTTVGTHVDLNSGMLSVRLSYQVVRVDGGPRYSQITIDLLRAFDTIAFYGFGR